MFRKANSPFWMHCEHPGGEGTAGKRGSSVIFANQCAQIIHDKGNWQIINILAAPCQALPLPILKAFHGLMSFPFSVPSDLIRVGKSL